MRLFYNVALDTSKIEKRLLTICNSSNTHETPQEKSDKSSEEQVEPESIRRQRISVANKGRAPWNIGKKHSPETIQLIRERTIQAMKNPKIRAKLRGYQQTLSPEVKAKISTGMRDYWNKMSLEMAGQRQCLAEWKECIAEAARKGEEGQEELQWDSYSVQLKQEKEEFMRLKKEANAKLKKRNIERSSEHKRKVADAIRAKWTSEEYRSKVVKAIRARFRPKASESCKEKAPITPPEEPQVLMENVPMAEKVTSNEVNENETDAAEKVRNTKIETEGKEAVEKKEIKVNGISNAKMDGRDGISKPPLQTFLDSDAWQKTEKLRQLHASRLLVEMKKKEATERAKMLMAEAEKAAQALEAIAYKDQFARASLVQTRKLLAEAARSIQAVESSKSVSELVDSNEFKQIKDQDKNCDVRQGQEVNNNSMNKEINPGKKEFNNVKRDKTLGKPQVKESSGEHVFATRKKKRWHRGRLISVDEDS